VGNVEFLSTHRGRRIDEVVDEIIFVLQCLGGAAHISVIMSSVEARLRRDRGEANKTIASDVLSALEAYDEANPNRVKPALFRRPFGPGSNRWALAAPSPPPRQKP